MPGLKSLVGLAFFGAIGFTMLILACALPGAWWPAFVLIFYILVPVPTLMMQRYAEQNSGGGSGYLDFAIFLTMGIVVSAFGLPIILYRAAGAVISQTACFLTLSANVVVFLTILGFFVLFRDDNEASPFGHF